MSAYERVQQVEIRVKKAALLIEKQREELAQLRQTLELVQMHNEELQKYADSYKEDTNLINESIDRSIETLDAIEGLDDFQPDLQLDDLDEAENFAGGEAVVEEDPDSVEFF
ncbi:MAG: hypothetical protein J5785_01330 [Spirochaetales bacterium]|nr:hypothetical protein [Spirochaetales bacterium]